MATAYQPDAFQNDAFQIEIEIVKTRIGAGYSGRYITPVITINGKILEYEKKHLEKLKGLLILKGKIDSIDKNAISEINVKLKPKSEIDIETLLYILADE